MERGPRLGILVRIWKKDGDLRALDLLSTTIYPVPRLRRIRIVRHLFLTLDQNFCIKAVVDGNCPMDQIQNNHSANSNPIASNSPTTTHHQLQYHIQQQRQLAQQQQQHLYNLLPAAAQSHLQSTSYPQQPILPPISGTSSQFYGEDLNSPTRNSPPNSASTSGSLPSGWTSHHRTSSSREEIHPSRQQPYEQDQAYQQQLEQQQREQSQTLLRDKPQPLKKERRGPMAYKQDERSGSGASTSSAPPQSLPRSSEDAMPSTSDFVKKLYKFVRFSPVVSSLWI